MHTSKDDYLINSLRFVSAKESTQIYGAILPECLTSPTMKESKAYKTYLGYATGVVPPKMARKFKKASPSKIDSDLVPVDEEPIQKGRRVKRPAKKSTTKPAACVVIRVAPVETKSKSKEKEKMKEVRKKSLRDFHKTHPSGSGMVARKPPSVDKITPTVTSEGTGDKPWVPDVTEYDSTESESKSWGNDDDDSNNDQDSSNEDSEQENESEEQVSDSEQEEESKDDDQEKEEFVHTPSPTDDKDDDNMESESDDVNKNNEESYDVFNGDKEIKTKVHVTSSSRLSDLASKFLKFLDIPHTNAETVSPLDVHVHHEVPRTQAPTLLTIPVYIITESSPVHTNIPQSSQTVTPPPILTTPNPPPTIETTNPLSTLPNFASVFRFNNRITSLEKEVVSSKTHSTYEAASTLTEFELKKILLDKMEKSESYLAAPEHRDCYDSLKKSYDLYKDFFFSYDVYSLKRSRKDKDKDEDPSAGLDRGLKKRKLSKDAKPTTGLKKKDSTSVSSKGTKSQLISSGKSVQSEEPMF
ncbi:hypothetical protein Tco_1270620, partial [Tanacetum coccineum]